jgi:hypothetical protein
MSNVRGVKSNGNSSGCAPNSRSSPRASQKRLPPLTKQAGNGCSIRAKSCFRQRRQPSRGLEQQIKRAHEQLEVLARRLEEGARSAKEATLAAARTAEEAIALRVKRTEARALLLLSKARSAQAAGPASKQEELLHAEELLQQATDLLQTAQAILADDHAYDALLAAMKRALRDVTVAVKTQAVYARTKMDVVLIETDKLVSALEEDEQKAA